MSRLQVDGADDIVSLGVGELDADLTGVGRGVRGCIGLEVEWGWEWGVGGG